MTEVDEYVVISQTMPLHEIVHQVVVHTKKKWANGGGAPHGGKNFWSERTYFWGENKETQNGLTLFYFSNCL